FREGFASPADALLDIDVAVALVKLVGFHWAFLPGVLVEALPGLDLAPTWTAAVLLATAGRGGPWARPPRLLAIAFSLALAVLLAIPLLFRRRRRGRRRSLVAPALAARDRLRACAGRPARRRAALLARPARARGVEKRDGFLL